MIQMPGDRLMTDSTFSVVLFASVKRTQPAPGAVFDVVIGDGELAAVPMVLGVEPVRRVAGKRAEPRRNPNRVLDESW